MVPENRELIKIGKKRCTRCRVIKDLEADFMRHPSAKTLGGRAARCKICIYETRTDRVAVKNPRGMQKFSKSQHEAHRATGQKYCPSCDKVLPIDDFNSDRSKYGACAPYCRLCLSRKNRARKFGLTIDQVVQLEAAEQCGACGVNFDESGIERHFDHCHSTGAFRDVICENCNVSLGMLKENVDRIGRLAAYAAKWAS